MRWLLIGVQIHDEISKPEFCNMGQIIATEVVMTADATYLTYYFDYTTLLYAPRNSRLGANARYYCRPVENVKI